MSEEAGKGPGMPDELSSHLDEQVQRELDEALGDASVDELLEQSLAQDAAAASAGRTDEAGDADDAGDDDHAGRFEMQLKRGRITQVRGDDVFVELAGADQKNPGIVPLTQFERPPRPGSIMDFVVERFEESEGLFILSREGAIGRATWDQLSKGAVVEARVVSTNKGGLELEMVGGIRGFMPASQVDLHYVENLEPLVGEKVAAVVQDIERKHRRVVLSRKQYLIHERESRSRKLWKELEVGQERDGTVSRIVEFGAFIDLGGADGLVHISDLSYSHVNKPSEVIKEGQSVRVKVLKLDPEEKKIRLGLKQVAPDPWEGIAGRYKAGDQVSGRVLRLADFGAFVEVETGVEALLPVSELSWKRIGRPSEIVKEGDVIRLAVMQVDEPKRRITLSLKQAQGDPWIGASHKYPRHSLVDARITRTTDFGAFAEIESGVEGLVHISELAPRRIGSVEEVVKVGDTRQFRVLEVDEDNRRIRLSLKAVDEPVAASAEEQAAADKAGKTPARKKKEHLKGGMDPSGALGVGLGNLKL